MLYYAGSARSGLNITQTIDMQISEYISGFILLKGHTSLCWSVLIVIHKHVFYTKGMTDYGAARGYTPCRDVSVEHKPCIALMQH